jgi:hypothetical protein
MKTLSLLLFTLLFTTSFGYAQESAFNVSYESPSTILVGEQYAYKVEVNRATKEEMFEVWEKRMKKYATDKPVVSEDFRTLKVLLKKIHPALLDMKYTAINVTGGARLGVMLKDSVGAVTSDRHQVDLEIQKALKEYGAEVYAEVLEREIKALNGALKDEEKALSKLYKEQDKIKEDQEENRLNIEGLKTTIKQKEGEASRLLSEANDFKAQEAAASSKEEAKAYKSQAKDKEKASDDAKKDIQKAHEDIFKLESEIRELENELGLAKKRAEVIQARIEELHKVIVSKESELSGLGL